MVSVSRIALAVSSIVTLTAAQTFQRLGACPSQYSSGCSLAIANLVLKLWDVFFLLIRPIFWLDSTLIFAWRFVLLTSGKTPSHWNRFMLQSMVPRQTVVSQIQTSASRLPKLEELLNQQQASSRLPSLLSKDGTSLGLMISSHKMPKPHQLPVSPRKPTDELLSTSQENMLLPSTTTMAQKRLPIGLYAPFKSRSVRKMSFSSLVCPFIIHHPTSNLLR